MKNRFFGFILLSAVILVPFTNCSSFSNSTNVAGLSTLSCTTNNCVIPDPTVLKITANTANGEMDITAALSEFNVGGDCNEGGFPFNQVHWELWDNAGTTNVAARNSSMAVAAGASADSKCINGRFMVYVNLASITGDAVNRTGLYSPVLGVRGSYLLKLYIFGRMTATDKNTTLNAMTSLPLSAY